MCLEKTWLTFHKSFVCVLCIYFARNNEFGREREMVVPRRTGSCFWTLDLGDVFREVTGVASSCFWSFLQQWSRRGLECLGLCCGLESPSGRLLRCWLPLCLQQFCEPSLTLNRYFSVYTSWAGSCGLQLRNLTNTSRLFRVTHRVVEVGLLPSTGVGDRPRFWC